MIDRKNEITQIKKWLAAYDGPDISIMEVCGSHTAAISKYGICGLLSEKIHLISGPGCPVCVTPSAYVDRLIELSEEKDTTVVTFGDLIRVPGSRQSLAEARGEGADVRMVYSPMETLELAKKNPNRRYVFAAVGFETTTPVYALFMEQMLGQKLENIRLLTAIKTMPPVIRWLCENGALIHGFLAPGHVCAVTGYSIFEPLAAQYKIPFGVGGFKAEELLAAIYGIARTIAACRSGEKAPGVKNYYPSVVTYEGNKTALEKVEQYFEKADALWRGMGMIPLSGKVLRKEYQKYDAGSRELLTDHKKNQACQCSEILMGRKLPGDCPLFGSVCTPMNPQGACMVSEEGSCHQYLVYHRTR